MADSPENEIVAGGEVDQVRVSLRIIGDDLDPDEVTRVLGVEPSAAIRKGERRPGGRVQRTGVWRLSLPHSREWVLEDAITTLLAALPSDLAVWQALGGKYRLDVFCGLFLDQWNRGADLSPAVLRELAERGLALGLDVYDPMGEDA